MKMLALSEVFYPLLYLSSYSYFSLNSNLTKNRDACLARRFSKSKCTTTCSRLLRTRCYPFKQVIFSYLSHPLSLTRLDLIFFFSSCRCRRANMWLPWTCEHLKHSYEVCMYQEYERRRRIKTKMLAEGLDPNA